MAEETYFDGFFIQVGLISSLHGGKERFYSEFFAQLPSGRGDLNELLKDLEAIASYEEDGQRRWHSFKSELSRGHHSWGADASTVTGLIDIAAGIGITKTLEGIVSIIRKYASDRKQQAVPDYTDDELVGRAKMLIVRRYNHLNRTLNLKSLERSISERDKATVTLITDTNEIISLKFQIVEGVAVVEWVHRELPLPSP
ncbi:hypothetical protein [Nakamurella sp. PAMC28650]|uniref:hypothetical protein n=1 Tax=Nakamurella sp. PAMC28650 TaxID=2762325 RepID=UPI00164ECF5D|nr:hypothetical protein [Nakamurella sp. PAMC28650]QNK82581.1 hypothetical protein H7F38_07705 [Nakamurella sp. PAMC28650]